MKKMLKQPNRLKRVWAVKKSDPVILHKDAAANALLWKLRSYLDAAEPELVYFLVNTWRAQGRAITYKELREAILNREINADLLEEWRQDYSRFVVKRLKPKWDEAMRAAVADMEAKYPEWYFDPMGEGVRSWTETHSAELVTNVTNTQIEGLRAVVRRAAVLETMTVDQLSYAIRPLVGLTRPQSVANLNYYTTLINNGIKEGKALDLSIRYAARQSRQRGYMIARTELAMAYNHGAHEGIKQAQAAGYMGEMKKTWCTADDERVCRICGGLEGKEFAMDDDSVKAPAHPCCRCTMLYKEISPPIIR